MQDSTSKTVTSGISINWKRSGWRAALQKAIWEYLSAAGSTGVSSQKGKQQHRQPVRRGDHLSVFSIVAASP